MLDRVIVEGDGFSLPIRSIVALVRCTAEATAKILDRNRPFSHDEDKRQRAKCLFRNLTDPYERRAVSTSYRRPGVLCGSL